MKLAWITDPHLDNIPFREIEFYFLARKAEGTEAFIFTGDIGESQNWYKILMHINDLTKLPVMFVLGNHDYWGSSFNASKSVARGFFGTNDHATIHYLPNGPCQIGKNTAICGVDGFYDGLAGTGALNSDAELHDNTKISDLSFPTRFQYTEALKKLGKESADEAEAALQAMGKDYSGCENWILATHVSPFKEAARHLDGPSEPAHVPFFVNAQLGEKLAELMTDKYPDHKLTVLCGHTHTAAEYKFSDNLLVRAGPAQYGEILTTMIETE